MNQAESAVFQNLLNEVQGTSQGKNHPLRGFEILRRLCDQAGVELDREEVLQLARIILQHHERMGGEGYPQGLKGDEIEPEAQIISLAEIYEALTHKLPGRDTVSCKEAMQEIIKLKDSVFPPELIKDLLAGISFYPVGSEVQLSNGQTARVIKVNERNPLCPIVEIILDAQGNKLSPPLAVDLSQETSLTICHTC